MEDFESILNATDASLVKQYQALLATERRRARVRAKTAFGGWPKSRLRSTRSTENIGARRLYTVIEKLLEEVSFAAGNHAGKPVKIDAAYVDRALNDVAEDEDMSRYVL